MITYLELHAETYLCWKANLRGHLQQLGHCSLFDDLIHPIEAVDGLDVLLAHCINHVHSKLPRALREMFGNVEPAEDPADTINVKNVVLTEAPALWDAVRIATRQLIPKAHVGQYLGGVDVGVIGRDDLPHEERLKRGSRPAEDDGGRVAQVLRKRSVDVGDVVPLGDECLEDGVQVKQGRDVDSLRVRD